MTPFEFGRLLKRAFELPPKPAENPNQPLPQKPLGMNPPAAAPPPPPAPKPAGNFWTGTNYKSNPTPLDDYKRTLSRYVSPWNQDNSGAGGNDRGAVDTALKWGTRGSLGLGAAAGTTAAAITAAPGVYGAMTGGAGTTTAAGAGGGAAAASQTPAGQNVIQRGAQMVGQFGNQAASTYQNTIDPTLKRMNYKPEDVIQDTYMAGTGNFDKIKGPGWGGSLPSMPIGAPSIPKPLESWKKLYRAGSATLPGLAHVKML